jgi:MFS family permease
VSTFASLRKYRNYRLYLGGQTVSIVGTWMQDTTLPWLMLQLTQSPTQVGLLVFCRYIPFFLLGLFSGALADRFDNRRLLMWSQAGQLVTTSALAVLAFTTTTPWPYFVLATLSGIGMILDGPSRLAITFQLVGREDIPNAVALSASMNNAGLVVGPALGGILIAAVGAGWCFTVNAVSFVVLLSSLLLIRARDLFPLAQAHVHAGTFAAIAEGLRYAWRTRLTRLVLSVVAVTALGGFNFRVILPILAERTLQSGPGVFGILFTGFGLGSVVGAFALAAIGTASWSNVLLGGLGFNVALVALAPVHSVAAATALLFVVGMCFTFWMANSQSIVQLSTPDHLRGRVISLLFFAWAGLGPISALLAGWLCDIAGTELALSVAGLTGIVTMVVATARVRRLPLEPVTS